MAKKPLGVKPIEDYDIFSSGELVWRSKALCRNNPSFPTSVFFASPKSADIAKAKSLCSTCSVSSHCLQNAIIYQYDGVWGGTTEDERSYIIKSLFNNDVSDLTLDQCKKLSLHFTA